MKKEVRQFNTIYALLSITVCIYSTFIMPYLKTKGFTFTELGIFTSINISAAIVGQFVMGYLCDLLKTIKKVFVINLIILLFISMIMQVTSNVYVVVFGIAAFGFFQAPLSVLLDSWVLFNKKEVSQNFGGIRAWSSIGWALCAISMGGIIDTFGWKSLFISYMIFAILALIATRNIEDVYVVRAKEKNNDKVNPLILFKDYRYIFVVLIMLLLTIAQQSMTFLYIKINTLGGTSKHIGIASFVMAISELPVFFSSKYIIKKFKLTNLLIFCSVMYIVRMVFLSRAISYNQVILIGTLQIFTFAIFVITIKFMIVEIAPKNLQITAQSTASAICAVGGILIASTSGYLIDKHGINIVFIIGAAASFMALIFMIVYGIFTKNRKARKA
jgi:PPP family 3-phenylpropionic acid transporter